MSEEKEDIPTLALRFFLGLGSVFLIVFGVTAIARLAWMIILFVWTHPTFQL